MNVVIGDVTETRRTRAPGPIRAALFDVFGTVVDWRTSVAAQVNSWMNELGETGTSGPRVDAFAFADEWRARYQPSMEPIRAGARPFVRLDVLHRESLVEVLAAHKVHVSDAEVDRLTLAWHSLAPWPDSADGLARIQTAMIISPLSNGNVSLLVDMARTAGLPWDMVLGADVARLYKPTPEAYLRAADILGLAPSEVLMVAAHNSDLAAARACGLRTAFVVRPTEHGPGQSTDLGPEQEWDFCSESLTGLATALDC